MVSAVVTLEEGLAPHAERVLLVLERDGVTRYRLTTAQKLSIGRSERCDIVLKDPLASRVHATLHIGEIIELEDQGSQNGTLLGAERLLHNQRASLESGEPVRIGSTLLVLQWAPRSADAVSVVRGLEAGSGARVVVEDPSMRSLYQLAARVAKSNINVLVYGETGVGKELVAETVHRNSGSRSAGPFVRINCAALGEQIFESEMFGHERGSFTGAVRAKAGLLETANTGTAFLDEVGELSLTVQAKLLRALESRQVMRVGGLTPKSIDVRFVAATNRDLKAEVARGRFREDLYYRLAGATLSIPPLRSRTSEVLPLVDEVARAVAADIQRPQPRFSSEAKKCLVQYRWPGNVRELRNVVECAILRAEGNVVDVADLPEELRNSVQLPLSPATAPSLPALGVSPAARDLSLSPQQAEERERILRGLTACNGNQTRAAEYLGMPRRTLVAKLAAYAIPRPRKPTGASGLPMGDQEPEEHKDGLDS